MPFPPQEILHHVILNGRGTIIIYKIDSRQQHQHHHLRLDCNRYELVCGDESVRLNNKEFQLAELFLRHPHFVFSTGHLMEKTLSPCGQLSAPPGRLPSAS